VNVLVYYLIDHPEFGDRAERWITDTDEIYTYLTKEDERTILRKLAEAFEGLNVEFVHLGPYELMEVYETARRNGLDFEDAIHYYCSRRSTLR